MSKDTKLDWENAYDSFDGDMKACTGKMCSAPCCNLKVTPTWNEGPKNYYTSLDTCEYDFQIGHFGSFDPAIQIELVDVGIDRGIQMRHLIKNCLADDGSCRLKNRKPMHCRIFPFSLFEHMPLISRCPQSKAIASCSDTQKRIIDIRRALGYTNHEQWIETLNSVLGKPEVK